MHSAVGWAKAVAGPSMQMKDSRAPCPPAELMRAAQPLVGTAHERPFRGERSCQRLCPPYPDRLLFRGDESRLSLRLDVGGADDLAPLLALGFDVRPERRGREHQRGDAELAELRFDGWI